MISSGRQPLQAMPQGLKAFAAQILVEVRRGQLSAILRGHVPLAAEERADLPVADVERVPQQRVAVLVAVQAIEPAGNGVADPPHDAPGPELREHDVRGAVRHAPWRRAFPGRRRPASARSSGV